MTDVYRQLATHLDNLPAGFPATTSGVELRILRRLFTPEEARTATSLTMMPEPAAGIARRTGEDDADLESRLDDMSRKGLIFRSTKKGVKHFMAAQFVIGIWEYHLNDLDEALIADVNEYLPQLVKLAATEQRTQQLRVVPVSKSLSAEATVMPYELAEEMIRKQSRISVAPCICRKEQKMVGKGCDKPMEVCLAFGSGAYFYEENGLGRAVSVDEALDILKTGMDAGLVLQPGNAKKPANICMCCGCCCQVLKNLNAMDAPARVISSNYYAEADAETCVACGLCAERCQMAAITVDEAAVVNRDRCIGCGLCVTDCPTEAMTMVQKPEPDRVDPPANLFETYLNIAKERGKI